MVPVPPDSVDNRKFTVYFINVFHKDFQTKAFIINNYINTKNKENTNLKCTAMQTFC